MKKLTTEDFIAKAREVHGDKYDYSKVIYVNNSTKVCIICPEHGEFWQIPSSHLKGTNCPLCCGRQFFTTDKFVSKAKEIHNNKYDYTKVDYQSMRKKVCIICHEHGEFWQTPEAHLNGHGCKKCAGQYSPSREEFISKAIEIHGNKYDYSKVNYTNCDNSLHNQSILRQICFYIQIQTLQIPHVHIITAFTFSFLIFQPS